MCSCNVSCETDADVALQTVTAVELEKKRVIVDGGKDSVMWDKLILAPGGTPRRLPVPGADLENVYTFRGIEDSKKVDAGDLLSHL